MPRLPFPNFFYAQEDALFEAARRRIGPHYWSEQEFAANLTAAGFTVLESRRTFLNGASVLVWARKDAE